MAFNIKRDAADIAFSQYMKAKICHCERCYSRKSLEVSHYWGRAHEATRFDSENCDVLCNYCHRRFHSDPGSYEAWKRKKLGDKRYDALYVRAHSYCKKDRKFQLLKIIENAKAEGIMLNAKQAAEKSAKTARSKTGADELLALAEKNINKAINKGRRHCEILCDNENDAELTQEKLVPFGYRTEWCGKIVKVEW